MTLIVESLQAITPSLKHADGTYKQAISKAWIVWKESKDPREEVRTLDDLTHALTTNNTSIENIGWQLCKVINPNSAAATDSRYYMVFVQAAVTKNFRPSALRNALESIGLRTAVFGELKCSFDDQFTTLVGELKSRKPGRKRQYTGEHVTVKQTTAPAVTHKQDETQHRDTRNGCVYMYTWPSYLELAALKNETRIRFKIGSHQGEDPMIRIAQQMGTSNSECPRIGFVYKSPHYRKLESLVHSILKIRGHKCSDSIGNEWYATTVQEVQDICTMICEETVPN